MAARQTFSSRFTTILSMVGVAVGLGNVWRFPYMMGEHGGSAFLVVYLAFTILLAIPAMTAEWALGRETGKGPIGALGTVWGSAWGKRIGSLLVFTMVVSTSYYLVVIGNILFTAVFSVTTGFDEASLPLFNERFTDGWLQFLFSLIVLSAAIFVLYRGVNKGIEAVSRLFVPFFTVVIVYLVINALFLPGAATKFAQFLKPDFSVLGVEHIFAALGQAFFSLGLAGTIMVIYGSYMQSDQDIPRVAAFTALGDVGAAVLASLFHRADDPGVWPRPRPGADPGIRDLAAAVHRHAGRPDSRQRVPDRALPDRVSFGRWRARGNHRQHQRSARYSLFKDHYAAGHSHFRSSRNAAKRARSVNRRHTRPDFRFRHADAGQPDRHRDRGLGSRPVYGP